MSFIVIAEMIDYGAQDRSVEDLEAPGASQMLFNLYDVGPESMAKLRSGPWR